MRSILVGGLLATALVIPAIAQSTRPVDKQAPAATAPAPRVADNVWRASKLKGLDVYNEQGEKLGDINEVLIDKSGKVDGVVIGVGGFLGMGEHDIKVDMGKLKFTDEPVRTSANANRNTTTGEANRSANTTRSNEHRWYPDHAVMANASKDQLKSMPQFKY